MLRQWCTGGKAWASACFNCWTQSLSHELLGFPDSVLHAPEQLKSALSVSLEALRIDCAQPYIARVASFWC